MLKVISQFIVQGVFSSVTVVSAIGVACLFFLSQLAFSYIESPEDEAYERGEALALHGRGDIPACISCHGAEGEGNLAAAIPRLAGLPKQYIFKQLQDFERDPVNTRVALDDIARDYSRTPRIYSDLTVFTPGTREHALMNSIAKKMTEKDYLDVALYFSEQPFFAIPIAYDFETLERGEDLALRGKPEYGLPACNSCHGHKGEGINAEFPPLAGQPPNYIVNQLDQWQRRSRDNDHLALMRTIADQLTDGDKQNIAAYYSNQTYSINMDEVEWEQ